MPAFSHNAFHITKLNIQISCLKCHHDLFSSARLFSTTAIRSAGRLTRQRRGLFRWLNGPGAVFREPRSDGVNYLTVYDSGGRLRPDGGAVGVSDDELSDEELDSESTSTDDTEAYQPFPMNPQFHSQPVLSEELKEAIWYMVTERGMSVRKLSATYGIDMRRVGAVLRLKEIEKRWEQEGKRLATPFNRAVLSMLPQTPFQDPPILHEPIHDLPVHKATLDQVFYPVAESRHFTRINAGTVFEKGLLPAEKRIAHPELVAIEKARLQGKIEEAIQSEEWGAADANDASLKEAREKTRQRREAATTGVQMGRWEFKFQDVVVDKASVGRYVPGIGSRYGVPPQDRKKGQVKIPTSVI